jgi:anti-sigma B factor antagonist
VIQRWPGRILGWLRTPGHAAAGVTSASRWQAICCSRRRTPLTGRRFPSYWAGSLAVVTLPAEIDAGNAREVDEELNTLLGQRPGLLVADMTETRFCDSSGIACLIRAWRRATALNVCFRVAAVNDLVLRAVNVLGANRVIDFYSGLEAAIADHPATAGHSAAEGRAGGGRISAGTAATGTVATGAAADGPMARDYSGSRCPGAAATGNLASLGF